MWLIGGVAVAERVHAVAVGNTVVDDDDVVGDADLGRVRRFAGHQGVACLQFGALLSLELNSPVQILDLVFFLQQHETWTVRRLTHETRSKNKNSSF